MGHTLSDRQLSIYGEISEELFDIASSASAEVEPEPGTGYYTWNNDFVVQYNYPKPIPFQGGLAYLRKERDMPLPTFHFLPRETCIPESYLAYTTQQGLLGRVIPSLRAVIVGVNEETKTLEFYFFYNEPVTEEMRQLSLEAIRVAAQAFSAEYKEVYRVQTSIECLPWPARITGVGQRYVFERMEPKPPWAFLEEAKNNS